MVRPFGAPSAKAHEAVWASYSGSPARPPVRHLHSSACAGPLDLRLAPQRMTLITWMGEAVSDRRRMQPSGRARRKCIVLLLIVATITACAIAAQAISQYSEVSFGLAMLGTMLGAYGALSLAVVLLRRRLVARLNHLPPAMQAAWRSIDPVVQYESATAPADGRVSARTATHVGVILINGPLIPLMVGPLFIGRWLLGGIVPVASVALLLLGFALAWTWWSVGVTLWRDWGARRGVDRGELQYRGQNASLLWPPGHFFERTELGNILKRWRRSRS